jgi:mono/diheme cytochrome c family protein
MLRAFFLTFLLLGVLLVAALGFRGSKSTAPPIEIFPDMVRQPIVRPQAPLSFFADNRGNRLPVAGTVPMGYEMPRPDTPAEPGSQPTQPGRPYGELDFSAGTDYRNTGRMGGSWGNGIPLEVNAQFMERGAERFNINCAICHGPTGAGDGIVRQYGMPTIVSIIDDRITNMPDGEIFDVITHGRNTMMSYGGQVTVNDRWAIIAYLRALQRRERATAADVPPEARVQLEQPQP